MVNGAPGLLSVVHKVERSTVQKNKQLSDHIDIEASQS